MRRSEIFKNGSDLNSNYRADSGFVRHLDIIVYKIPALKKTHGMVNEREKRQLEYRKKMAILNEWSVFLEQIRKPPNSVLRGAFQGNIVSK